MPDLRGEVGGKQKATDPINLASIRNATNLKHRESSRSNNEVKKGAHGVI